jgi:hypothetical protein
LKRGQLVTGEWLRLHCKRQPHHPNAWGAVVNTYVRLGVLEKTGDYVQPQDARSHGRAIQVYRRA